MTVGVTLDRVRGSDSSHTDERDFVSSPSSATQAIEDVLVGAAMVAFAVESRIGRHLLLDAAQLLIEARVTGRSQQVLVHAHEDAASLPDWLCSSCSETDPGTFDVCWNCLAERATPGTLSPSSEALLAIEAAIELDVAPAAK